MCWIVYKKNIFGYDEEILSDGFNEFIVKVEYIVKNCY